MQFTFATNKNWNKINMFFKLNQSLIFIWYKLHNYIIMKCHYYTYNIKKLALPNKDTVYHLSEIEQ